MAPPADTKKLLYEQMSRPYGAGALILAKQDKATVTTPYPLILKADSRVPMSPYFGYYPPGSEAPELVIIDHREMVLREAAKWSIWQPGRKPASAKSLESTQIKAVDGKGLTMTATRNIKKGEVVVEERPFYIAEQALHIHPDQQYETGDFHRSAISRLGPAQQEGFLTLVNCYEHRKDYDEIPGKLFTNFITIGMKGTTYSACYKYLSRASHSCSPNSNHCFDEQTCTGRFFAMQDIKAGEEITISYDEVCLPRLKRQELLLSKYHFLCRCAVCAVPAESVEAKVSDSKRDYVAKVIEDLSRMPSRSVRPIKIEDIDKAVRLAQQEGLAVAEVQVLARSAGYLKMMSITKGFEYRLLGKQYLGRAKELVIAYNGADSSAVRELAFLERM